MIRVECWCDGCGKKIPRVEVQWSSCEANGWRNLDFCGYACADKKRAEVLATAQQQESP